MPGDAVRPEPKRDEPGTIGRWSLPTRLAVLLPALVKAPSLGTRQGLSKSGLITATVRWRGSTKIAFKASSSTRWRTGLVLRSIR
jgi:hypothetical protein